MSTTSKNDATIGVSVECELCCISLGAAKDFVMVDVYCHDCWAEMEEEFERVMEENDEDL